jgi:hypothetical protein
MAYIQLPGDGPEVNNPRGSMSIRGKSILLSVFIELSISILKPTPSPLPTSRINYLIFRMKRIDISLRYHGVYIATGI